jgi:D-alanyl-D-alanine carboxypeptidase
MTDRKLMGCKADFRLQGTVCMRKLRSAMVLLPFLFTLGILASPASAPAQSDSTLATRIDAVTTRPEYQHASFGIEVYSLDEDKVLYALNPQQLFTPGSTTKLLTEGTALELLGADYRFHTRVYRTGPIMPDGTLNGDLILVASGDPNLSGRIQPDGSLAFQNEDHSYDGSPDTKAVSGDPLLVIHELAAQVAAKGIKHISGRILVDAKLFPEGAHEGGTQVVISPLAVNDNIVDITISPGAAEGAAANVNSSPATGYVTFVNHTSTGDANSKADIQFATASTNPDGNNTVTINGSFPLGKQPILYAYDVPVPSRFAQATFTEALREKGILATSPATVPATAPATVAQSTNGPEAAGKPDYTSPSPAYTAENLVAEHISPPLSEEIKVTLKVSQNLHASMTPFLLGAILSHNTKDFDQAGFDLERQLLQKAGLDLSGASQGDGAGGAESAFFTPDFMVHYLAFMSHQKDFAIFKNALPVLGRDGTLWNIQVDSPAAGHVFAKTGTYGTFDALNKKLMLTGKGLAGYTTTSDGHHLAFAIYVNRVSLPLDDPDGPQKIVGEALGEIAGAIYSSPVKQQSDAASP